MKKIIHSGLIRWIWGCGFFFMVLLTLLRLVFYKVFIPAGETGIGRSLWMGFRYDARLVASFLVLLLILGFFLKPYAKSRVRRVYFSLTGIFIFLLISFYTFDFAHYAYLRRRLNASVLNYMEDQAISLNMVWQSYPVIRILLGWVIAFAAVFFVCKYLFKINKIAPAQISRRNVVISYIVSFLVFAVAIFGRVGQFPLRWSDAYRLGNQSRADIALNPFQSFMSSLKFRKEGFDQAKVKTYYPLMAKQLGVDRPDSGTFSFARTVKAADSVQLISRRPNIVLVICESFSGYKSSMWGNPLNTTPYFNELTQKGVFFTNCFSPAYGTARGVWAIMTGIPDVAGKKTASRDPNVVDQHIIMNEFTGYKKFYFLGGSASWANIRGLLEGNIDGLQLYEEEDYKSPKVDVWGISDKNLFLEANAVLKQQTEPFFAIIQTADNHRPYTIPEEDRKHLELRQLPDDSLRRYGFWSNEELNAYTYMDYTYKTYFEAAAKEKYFDNTLFVFVGDHGIRGDAKDMFPKVWTEQGLTCQHVPLLFYAPSFLQPKTIGKKVSQVDIMPTIAALSGMPVRNTTLGKNIFASDSATRSYSFVIDPDEETIGLAGEKYFYQYSFRTKKDGFFSMTDNRVIPPGEPEPALNEEMRNLAMGYYETARYLLFTNKRQRK